MDHSHVEESNLTTLKHTVEDAWKGDMRERTGPKTVRSCLCQEGVIRNRGIELLSSKLNSNEKMVGSYDRKNLETVDQKKFVRLSIGIGGKKEGGSEGYWETQLNSGRVCCGGSQQSKEATGGREKDTGSSRSNKRSQTQQKLEAGVDDEHFWLAGASQDESPQAKLEEREEKHIDQPARPREAVDNARQNTEKVEKEEGGVLEAVGPRHQ